MNEAVGGAVNVALIAIFMVLISGYMAFNVSYVKAFKVKNRIIDLVEQYEGDCDPNQVSECTNKIHNYMDEIGYHNATGGQASFCSETAKMSNGVSDETCCNPGRGYCIGEVRISTVKKTGSKVEGETKSYYRVLTQVSIDIPIINKLMENMRVFEVTGETKTIKIKNG